MTLGRGWVDYYVRSGETEQKGSQADPLTREVDAREGLRASRWLRLLTCRVPRFFPILFRPLRTQCAGCRLIPTRPAPLRIFMHAERVTKRRLLFHSSQFGV